MPAKTRALDPRREFADPRQCGELAEIIARTLHRRSLAIGEEMVHSVE